MARRRAQRLTACEGAAPEVCAVEAGSEDHAVLEAQLLHDVGLHPRRGGGCQRQKRHARIPASPKVFPPCNLSPSPSAAHTVSMTREDGGGSFQAMAQAAKDVPKGSGIM